MAGGEGVWGGEEEGSGEGVRGDNGKGGRREMRGENWDTRGRNTKKSAD